MRSSSADISLIAVEDRERETNDVRSSSADISLIELKDSKSLFNDARFLRVDISLIELLYSSSLVKAVRFLSADISLIELLDREINSNDVISLNTVRSLILLRPRSRFLSAVSPSKSLVFSDVISLL